MEVGWGDVRARGGRSRVVVDECCGGKLDGGIDEVDVKKPLKKRKTEEKVSGVDVVVVGCLWRLVGMVWRQGRGVDECTVLWWKVGWWCWHGRCQEITQEA